MKIPLHIVKFSIGIAAALGAALPMSGVALPLADAPLFLTGDVPPFVMLNISKDHQLSYKAYTDYTDLTGDGTPETSYLHSFDYYGYFDSKKCYSYDTGTHRFVPQSVSTDKYCTGQWSGNFLNWAAMSRMDIVRKILYGGFRAVDTSTLTVLERAYLPTDAHSFAKYYNGSDIGRLTPFGTTTTTATSGSSSSAVQLAAGDRVFATSLSLEVGDQVRAVSTTDASKWMIGGVKSKSGTDITLYVEEGGLSSGSGTYTGWTLTNLSSTGITLCNLTPRGSYQYSQQNVEAPLIRVVKGNFALWGANEKKQCLWQEEASNLQGTGTGRFRSNGNRAHLSGILASAENPKREVHGLGTGVAKGAYVARVEACKSSSLLGAENCKRYGTTSYKPIGLLQQYGDEGLIHFGLATGTFSKNISGGVIRQQIANFGSGVDQSTGVFLTSGTPATPTNGIVRNLNKLRIYGYDYDNNSSYNNDGCTYQRTGILVSGATDPNVNEGSCSSWGNPMSEIYYESLRYLASSSTTTPTAAFIPGSGSKDATLGLTVVSSWTPPLNNENYCTPLSVLNFNASVSSYDQDQVGSLSGINSSQTASALTDAVGAAEGIHGKDWFIGTNGTMDNDLCSAKSVTGLGGISGLCPEAPSQDGSYLMSGLAHHARTNRIKPLPTGVSGTAYPGALKVETYGVALATNVPRIQVKVGENNVTILPAYRLDISSNGSGPFGGGSLVDFKVIYQTATSGQFYVNWEDSEMGGDYDQDVWGVIKYEVVGNTIKVTTDTISASTSNGQGFGYVISGTDKDGPHFHSGILGFDYTDPIPVVVRNAVGTELNGATGPVNTSGGCRNCETSDAPTTVTYNVTGNSAGNLKDPLWYSAKYGGFKDSNNNQRPDVASEWDGDNDGNPDNFVFASDPQKLVDGLAKTFDQIMSRRSSFSAVASNSTALSTESAIYQASFDSSDWSGDLVAKRLTASGQIGTQIWSAADRLPAHASRNIFTMSGTTGTSFQWANLTAAQQTALNKTGSGTVDTLGEARVSFLRGDRSGEQREVDGVFRNRTHPLGDVVNSAPFYVKQQYFGYESLAGTEGSTYWAFMNGNASRTPMIYVGGNDGMLHGFNANTGAELFAYVPKALYSKLPALADTDYSHQYYVDGSPYVGEAYIGGWKTILVSGLGAGGRSIFALDVTSPATFDASKVMWEYTDTDLCYTFSQPQVARLPSGDWAAVFGNGYPRTGGTTAQNCATTGAFLYVVRLSDGALIAKIGTGAASTYDGANNGLSTPALVDSDGDRTIDTVFAGDLRGNLWKYDLSSTNTGNWKVAIGSGSNKLPLFTATDGSLNQPITTAPEIGRHANGGFMVYFGTGRYVAVGDPSTTTVQTMYGIWDKISNSGASSQVTSRSSLQQQTITAEATVGTDSVRVTSNASVDWTTKRGWYMDMVQPPSSTRQGERVVSPPLLRHDRVLFTTLIPSTATCSFGGTSWEMEMTAQTGQRPEQSVYDFNNDGLFNAGDHYGTNVVTGVRSTVGITQTPVVVSSGGREYRVRQGTDKSGENGGNESRAARGGSSPPRGSWRQIIAK